MQITSLHIKNFRNIEDLKINFYNSIEDKTSIFYLTGENSIGKSNLIDLIYALFTERNCIFDNDDFKDSAKPIQVQIDIKLEDRECGLFNDYQDEDNKLTMTYTQYHDDQDYIDFYFGWSNKDMSTIIINPEDNITFDFYKNRLIWFPCYRYNPQYDLNKEFLFQNNSQIGQFFKFFISKQPSAEAKIPLNPNISDTINEFFQNFFNTPSPSLKIDYEDVELTDLLFSVSKISGVNNNEKLPLSKLGRGRSYYLYPFMHFLGFIHKKLGSNSKNKKNSFIEESENDNNNYYFSPIILFDEPEVFLSPFLQRQFMDQWINLLNDVEFVKNFFSLYADESNEDTDKYFIEPLFFISTHSAHIIPHLNLHEKVNKMAIYRLHEKDGRIAIGHLKEQTSELKQFLLFDRSILEGLFAKKVILVEGDTEVGFIPLCLEKSDINIHDKHILIIKSSPLNFPNLTQILVEYGIEVYIVTDRDADCNGTNKKDERVVKLEELYNENELVTIFVSDLWDFEESLLQKLKDTCPKIYDEIKLSRSTNITANSSSNNEEFNKKLTYRRENKKTIADNYLIAIDVLQNDCKLPNYIQKLIEILRH